MYLHTDHLDTPRLATDATGKVIWTWEGSAFGATLPNEDPDGDRKRTRINLRFAGQYYDSETGLHYNWNRYYDPQTGRYISSDPIGIVLYQDMAARNLATRGPVSPGLAAQLYNSVPLYNHPYSYVRGNPISLTDALGLADFLDRCKGRYASCTVTQYPNASTVGNWLRWQVCQRSINEACSRAGTYCCDEESRQCYANAVGGDAATARCAQTHMQCVSKAK